MRHLLLVFVERAENGTVSDRGGGNGLQLNVKADHKSQAILPWQGEDGILYFFLPSGVDDRIYFDKEDNRIFIDGRIIDRRKGFTWEPDTVYRIEAADIERNVIFMKSENLPAFFVSTESGSMDWLHENKENEEQGMLSVFSENGAMQYTGDLEAISGRGNSTWKEEKKPYTFTLEKQYPLCGMSSGKTWKLLALYYEHDKIHSKITYDMARELGLKTTPDCTWVDLYCNGEYQGLYLLTESKKRKLPGDVKWLLEKTHKSRFSNEAEEQQAFVTDMGYWFQTEMIQSGTEMKVSDAAAAIQQIEDLISSEDEAYKEYLDLDSLARKFLLEKIVMNYDAMACSAYFTLNTDGRLYAGPAWDYDNTFGTSGFFDYTSPMEGAPNEMTGWFHVLYRDEDFHSCLVEAYRELLPYLNAVLAEGIDEYRNYVEASVSMDLVRWGMAENKMFIYREYDSYIRYLKYFLANRLNYFNELWGIEGWKFEEPKSTGVHTVTFQSEDNRVLETWQVEDGTCMEALPDLDEELFIGWYFCGIDKRYESYFPVYGDMTLCAKVRDTGT